MTASDLARLIRARTLHSDEAMELISAIVTALGNKNLQQVEIAVERLDDAFTVLQELEEKFQEAA